MILACYSLSLTFLGLQWELGNYYQSFLIMLGFQMGLVINKPALSSNCAAFLDPSIGKYCLTLATKNIMRNAVGEQNAAILGRWATLMMATALRRCGLPVSGFVVFLCLFSIMLPDRNMTLC